MTRHRLLLLSLGCSLVAALVPTALSTPREDHASQIRELSVQKRDKLIALVDAKTKQHEFGTGDLVDLLKTRIRLLEAEYALVETPERRLEVLRQIEETAEVLVRGIRQRDATGSFVNIELSMAEACLCEVKIAVLREMQSQEEVLEGDSDRSIAP